MGFSKIDTDGDNALSKDELSAFREEMEAQFASSVTTSQYDSAGVTASTEDLFSKIDTDSDGSISSTEFSTFQSNMQAQGPGGTPPPPPDSSTQSGSDTSSTNGIFSEMDTNQDGTVSASEYAAFFSKMEDETAAASSQAADGSSDSGTNSLTSALMMGMINKYMQFSQYDQSVSNPAMV